MGILDSLFDPGKKDRKRAAGAGREGVITGSSFSGPGGISGGFDFSGGKATFTSDLGQFQNMFNQFQTAGQQSFDQFGQGLPPELLAAMQQGQAGLRPGDTNQQNFAGLGQVFQSALGTATADPFELGSGISAKLRALSERRNQRQVSKFFDRLQSTGNLTSSAGIQRAGDLERNQFEQGLQFDLAGLQAGQGLQQQAFGQLLGATQGREGILGRQFGENQSSILASLGIDQQMFQNLMNQQQQSFNLGSQATQGAANLAQLPLAFQNAANQGAALASGSQFDLASVFAGNAAQAKSPFLEAIKAAGTFAGATKPTAPAGSVN